MRTIDQIKADLAKVKENLLKEYVNTDWCELELELRQALTSGIDTDHLEEICRAEQENRLLILPVPIGGKVCTPYLDYDVDGTPLEGIDESYLSGYINEAGREFYTTYDAEYGTMDIEPDLLYTTREAAEAKLAEIKSRKCRVCGCTWDHACPGGCYWVEADLCSRCAELGS